MNSFYRALAAFCIVLTAFVFCVLASTFGLLPIVTGPAAAVSAAGLIACGVWLNRAAGKTDGEDPQ